MKYIMLETPEGQKLPIIFPDALTHAFVAGAMQLVIQTFDPRKDLRHKQLMQLLEAGDASVISAGFCELGDVEVHGSSESLGDLDSRPVDAAYIGLGSSVAFMPEPMVEPLWQMAKDRKR